MNIYAMTHPGKVRLNNEDSIAAYQNDYCALLVVADGMGGARKGEIASRMVIDTFSERFKKLSKVDVKKANKFFTKAIKIANTDIYEDSLLDGYENMGTTLVSALITGDFTYLVSCGDSRIYTYSKTEGLKQETIDQNYVTYLLNQGLITKEELEKRKDKNIITNAIGVYKKPKDIEHIILDKKYDILLCCSDGLFNMLSDLEIESILSLDLPVRDICTMLIDKANEKGGKDNIGVAIIKK